MLLKIRASEDYASEIRACQGPPEIFEFEIPLNSKTGNNQIRINLFTLVTPLLKNMHIK